MSTALSILKYLPAVADEDRRGHLLVAIDRATRFVVISIVNSKTAANVPRLVRYLELPYPAITSLPHTPP